MGDLTKLKINVQVLKGQLKQAMERLEEIEAELNQPTPATEQPPTIRWPDYPIWPTYPTYPIYWWGINVGTDCTMDDRSSLSPN
jgi:hypothetical protein